MSDLIDRQAVLDKVNKAETKECAIWSIKELPSEERPHGHWMYGDRVDLIGEHGATCSVCGKESEDNGYYCSWCGAKMDDELQWQREAEVADDE